MTIKTDDLLSQQITEYKKKIMTVKAKVDNKFSYNKQRVCPRKRQTEPPPLPLLKCKIELLVPKDAQCSETYATKNLTK